MGFKLALCGVGSFGRVFIPLFKAHPGVDEVALCDLLPDRLAREAELHGVRRTFASFQEALRSDVDAVAIFSQRHLHAAHTLEALAAGKHVYCAVPMAHTLEDIERILEAVRRSGKIYMTGETSYYYASTVFCRKKFREGAFGPIVHGEAAYLHDMTHGFYDAFKNSGGADWKRVAGFPPMFYGTHSLSMIASVTGARATHIACLGYRDRHEDDVFRAGANLWDNPFSNETALARFSDGSTAQLKEHRRVGWKAGNSVAMSLFGERASFSNQGLAQTWVTLEGKNLDVSKDLLCSKGEAVSAATGLHEELRRDFYAGYAPVHDRARIPREIAGLHNGHDGSHHFLVDDFVRAVSQDALPPNHAWAAARYAAPGIVAHESALRDGAMLPIPDFGEPEAEAKRLEI
ncbi:MAG: Gfo/Idh/MocA family oxidoreductase [Spirochaetes bacterium]|nr:Gfo/Idh/MocA family oxidoreductase [Spirochaetota bacterium]